MGQLYIHSINKVTVKDGRLDVDFRPAARLADDPERDRDPATAPTTGRHRSLTNEPESAPMHVGTPSPPVQCVEWMCHAEKDWHDSLWGTDNAALDERDGQRGNTDGETKEGRSGKATERT